MPGNSFIHRLKSEIKILGIVLLSSLILIAENFWFYLFMISIIIVMVLMAKTSLIKMLLRIWGLFPIILFSFLLPVFFNEGGENAYCFGPFEVGAEALSVGVLYSARIIVLLMLATLLVQTTSIAEMTRGLKNILYPFKIFGINPEKTGKLLTLSWRWIPELWKELRSMMKFLMKNKEHRLRNIMTALADFLVFLFQKEHP